MEILLGGLSAVLFGTADFLGGEGSKRAPAASIVLWSGVISFPVITVVALRVGGDAVVGGFALGVLAGVSGVFGLVLLFAGLARSRAAAVAPVSAVAGAMLPVFVALIGGERPSELAWAGVGLAIPAILLSAWVADSDGTSGGGFLFGLAAGLGFGGFTSIIQFTSEASNLLPLIASRGAAMAVVLAFGAFGVWKVVGFSAVPRRIVAANGSLT